MSLFIPSQDIPSQDGFKRESPDPIRRQGPTRQRSASQGPARQRLTNQGPTNRGPATNQGPAKQRLTTQGLKMGGRGSGSDSFSASYSSSGSGFDSDEWDWSWLKSPGQIANHASTGSGDFMALLFAVIALLGAILLSCLYFAYIQRRRVLSIYGPLNHPAMHATRLAARTFASPAFALPNQLGHLGPTEQIELGKLDKSRFPFNLPRTLIQKVCSRRQMARNHQQQQHELNTMSNYGNSYNNLQYDPHYDPHYESHYDPHYDPHYIHP